MHPFLALSTVQPESLPISSVGDTALFMAAAPLEAGEIALSEQQLQQQGLIFDKLEQAPKPGHLVVAELLKLASCQCRKAQRGY